MKLKFNKKRRHEVYIALFDMYFSEEGPNSVYICDNIMDIISKWELEQYYNDEGNNELHEYFPELLAYMPEEQFGIGWFHPDDLESRKDIIDDLYSKTIKK